jgi:hypothetical protein
VFSDANVTADIFGGPTTIPEIDLTIAPPAAPPMAPTPPSPPPSPHPPSPSQPSFGGTGSTLPVAALALLLSAAAALVLVLVLLAIARNVLGMGGATKAPAQAALNTGERAPLVVFASSAVNFEHL